MAQADSIKKALLIGPRWHGRWVDFVYRGFLNLGLRPRLIYSNHRWFGGTELVKKILLRQRLREVFDFEPDLVLFIQTRLTDQMVASLPRWSKAKRAIWVGDPNQIKAAAFSFFDAVFVTDDLFRELYLKWYPELKATIIEKVHLLPHASDPEIYRPLPLPKTKPVVFIGDYQENRERLLAPLADHHLTIYGDRWSQDGARASVTPEEANLIYNQSQIGLGTLDTSGVNQRTFDLALSGCFQLSQTRPLLERLFDGCVATFKNGGELLQSVKFYLGQPEECRLQAETLRKIALERHTMRRRIRELLKRL